MIKVTISRHKTNGTIISFSMSGHAGYADPGQDIVCAAASGISFGTINAIDQLLNTKLHIEMDEKTGFLHCVVPTTLETSTQEKVQLLLEGMLVSLESVASEYGQYITISK